MFFGDFSDFELPNGNAALLRAINFRVRSRAGAQFERGLIVAERPHARERHAKLAHDGFRAAPEHFRHGRGFNQRHAHAGLQRG